MQSDTRLTYTGLARRVKQHILAQPRQFFAVAAPGLEPFLAEEIRALAGAVNVEVVEGGVTFDGPFGLVYTANLELNTAVRVLMRIETFTARSYPELFDKVTRVAWERYIGFGPSIGVEVSARKSRLHHDRNVASTVFSAIEKTLAGLGVRIKLRIDAPLRVYVRLHDDVCTLSMDSSGEMLYKRGYRTETSAAPLRETSAAALLMACEFGSYPVIADPLCGSGVFIIEAARMLRAIPPGAARRFAFEAWPSFGEATWNHLKTKAVVGAAPATAPATSLFGLDADATALKTCGSNARRAGLLGDLVLAKADCREFNADGHYGSRGLVIANLPYGKRLTTDVPLEELYTAFGDRLRKSCSGWRFGLLTADRELERRLRLRSDRTVSFVNGGIPVRFITGMISA